MKLRPGEPEGLVAAEIGPVSINRLDSTAIQFQTDVLKRDLPAAEQRRHGLAALESDGFSR